MDLPTLNSELYRSYSLPSNEETEAIINNLQNDINNEQELLKNKKNEIFNIFPIELKPLSYAHFHETPR